MQIRGWRALGLLHFAILNLLPLVFFSTSTPHLFAQAPQTPPFQERIVLDTELTTVKQMGAVEDFIRDGQWSDAIEKLRQIRGDQPESLVPIRFGRYVTVDTYADLILANFPPAGLSVYRNRMDAQARRWFVEGRQHDDVELLQKVVDRAFVSSFGDDALFRLGELAWDRGEPAAARDYWQQILPLPEHVPAVPVGKPLPVRRYPDTDLPRAEILGRLVLCSVVQGRLDQARVELAVFEKTYPKAVGYLAGRDGNLAETLTEVIQAAEKWPDLGLGDNVVSFAKNPERNTIYKEPVDVGAELWSTSEWPMSEFSIITPRRGEFRWPPMHYPVVTGDVVLMCDAENIFAFDLETGGPKWPLDANDPDTFAQARIYPPGEPLPQPGPNPEIVGIPRFTLTVAENRVYAKMGTPITSQKSNSIHDIDNQIVCLDLAQLNAADAGEPLAWLVNASEVRTPDDEEAGGQWLFEGSPIVDNGRVFVTMRRSRPQTEIRVVCFDAETATQLWSHTIGAAIFNLNDRRNYASHNLLTVAGNTIFCSTEMGAIAALNTQDGRIRWIVTYESQAIENTDDFSDPQRIGLTPCVFHEGLVFAAPSDSEDVMAINADTGVMQWSQRIRRTQDRILHLLGVVDDRVILSGRQIWGLDRQTGRVAYPQIPRINTPPSTGRGVIAGNVIYRPTHETIERLNTRTGRPVGQPISLRQRGGRGGNLTIASDVLLVAESSRLVAYANVGRIKDEAEKALAANPKSARAWFRLATAESLDQNFAAAAEGFQNAMKFATHHDKFGGQPLLAAARDRRRLALKPLIETAIRENRTTDAITLLEDILKLTHVRSQRSEFHVQLARLIEPINPKKALSIYQQLIQENLDGPTIIDGEQWEHARDRIAHLLEKHGPELRTDYEDTARRALNSAISSRRQTHLERLTVQFPVAGVVSKAMLEAARDAADKDDFKTAFSLWSEIRHSSFSSDIRQAALVDSAEALATNEFWFAAAQTWRELAKEFPSARIGPNARPALEAVPSLLAKPPYLTELGRNNTTPLPWRQSWNRDIPPEALLIVPVGMAPGKSWESVLLQTAELTCLSATDGEPRWSRTWSRPIQWAAYGRRHLLVATDANLTAFELATGDSVWTLNTTSPEAEQSDATFQLVPPYVLVISSQEIVAIDWESGHNVWRQHFPSNLSPVIFADETHIGLQQTRPPRTQFLKTSTGEIISTVEQVDDAGIWQSAPVRLGPREFAVVDVDHHVSTFTFDRRQTAWRYTGPLSHARTSPRLQTAGDALLLFIDGDTVCRLDPETGANRWTTPLGFPPIDNIDTRTVTDENHLWIASQRTLRCLSLTDGKTLWKSAPAGDRSLAIQRHNETLLWLTESATHLLDAKSGQIRQTLPTPQTRWLTTQLGRVLSQQSGRIIGWTGGFHPSNLAATDADNP
ncbi:outer membrane protein assembly factor BamB family protein [Thalassoroseus pseudoceratinae]|uniref:outer membrane protein assembly factor BamB family protein n=1 Tax=Thalassoroseus pseudoceratinae TaxID=2713176 RepID=UPI00142028A2|nr:PQQ-binding-like beta-propeller repeat protein [Thalassoroseus pseudoceratinae]